MKLVLGLPGCRCRMRVHSRGHLVTIDDGHEPVTLKATNSPMAKMLVAKLTFLASARPEWSPGEALERAIFEIEAFENRRARLRRRWGRC